MESQSDSLKIHVRSISLPSRLHPSSVKVEAQLNSLKTWEISSASAAPLCAETIQIGLVGLEELYNALEEFIHIPNTRQAFVQPQCGALAEEALKGSVGLLDSCGCALDLFSMMKEHVKDLQSALRRKGVDLIIESNISAYICFRKKAKKNASKSLRALKQLEEKIVSNSNPLLNINNSLLNIIRVVGEVTSITIRILRSLWLFLSVPASETKPSGWSSISKLMLTRPATSGRGQKIINVIGNADVALYTLYGHIRNNNAKVGVLQLAQTRLKTLNASIEGIEGGLECLHRRLIQSRCSLLNMLAH